MDDFIFIIYHLFFHIPHITYRLPKKHGITLKTDEHIILIVRRYGLTLFWHFLLATLIIGIAFFFMFWLFRHGWWGQTIFGTVLFIGLWIMLRTLFLWRKTMLIITSDRMIDIDQKNLLEKIISEIPYGQIEDAAGHIKGVFGTLFRYGRLTIQTGNGKVRIIVQRIKHPERVLQLINRCREQKKMLY